MLLTENIEIGPCWSKLQLAKVGAFFWDTVYRSRRMGWDCWRMVWQRFVHSKYNRFSCH